MFTFKELKNTPEFFRRYIEQYLTDPQAGSKYALTITKQNLFNDDSFQRQWNILLEQDKIILYFIANGTNNLFDKENIGKLGSYFKKPRKLYKNIINNSLRRLTTKNILTKIEFSNYQFEDLAFEDWVKYQTL